MSPPTTAAAGTRKTAAPETDRTGPARRGARSTYGRPSYLVLRLIRRHQAAFCLGALLSTGALTAGLAQPLLVREVVAAAGHGVMPWTAASGLAALFAAQALLQAAGTYVLGRTGEAVVLHTRQHLVSRLLRLPVATYHRYRLGDLISRTGTDTTTLRTATGQACTDAVTGVLGLVGTLALMAWIDLRLLGVAVAVTTLTALIALPALSRIRPAAEEAQRATGHLTADLERALTAMRTVRMCDATARETARIAGHARTAHNAGVRIARANAVLVPAAELTLRAALMVTIVVGALNIAHGTGTTADLMAFLLYLDFLAHPLTALISAAGGLQQAAGASARITEVLELPEERDTGQHGEERDLLSAAPGPAAGHAALQFQNVWFGYVPRHPVLRGISFRLPPLGVTALLGDSGTGKTTVLGLVSRFHTPDSGRVLLGGVDIHTLPLREYRSTIGLVEQESPVLHGTLRDNLTYAAPGLADTDLWETLRMTGLAQHARSLPQGLDTPVGDHGATLSGGQRQRIAIARALAARPALILLDEPTAHLDPASERSLLRTLNEIGQHCAVLVVTHRSSVLNSISQHLTLTRSGCEIQADLPATHSTPPLPVTGPGN